MIKKNLAYFSKTELLLWSGSLILILIFFLIFDRENYLTLSASLIGVTSLIFIAKGNPAGQLLMVIFSLLYGIIAINYSYYGEMFTYLGMTMPMAIIALISWLRHPYKNNRAEVSVNRISRRETVFMFFLSLVITVIFYFILKYLGTANLLLSTLSVLTSFVAVYLTFRRSPFYAIAYSLNDLVLILLWILASFSDLRYISVVVCFIAFLFNDIYGYLSWRSMEKRQLG